MYTRTAVNYQNRFCNRMFGATLVGFNLNFSHGHVLLRYSPKRHVARHTRRRRPNCSRAKNVRCVLRVRAGANESMCLAP